MMFRDPPSEDREKTDRTIEVQEKMKLHIDGGRVIDPANGQDRICGLWLADGKVAGIGTAKPDGWDDAACVTLDARGMIVSPGFLDMHMHEDPLTKEGTIETDIFNCMLRMGVTTAVGGNCGQCKAEPVRYLGIADRDGAPVNVAMFAGHGYFRRRAGITNRYAHGTPEQIAALRELLRAALDGGCVGISFGVRYDPGTDAGELDAAVSAAAGTGKPVAAHVRDDAAAVFAAIAEMKAPARKYGLPLQISHIGSMGGFGQMEEVLADLDRERAAGLDIAMDCYPYAAFSTSVGSTTYDDGWLERYGCDYSVLEFCDGPCKGQRATAESFARMRREHPGVLTVCYVMRDEDVALALAHPLVAVASDGTFRHSQGHPRAAGTFPRFLSSVLRDGTMPLSEAIRKMTALPAARIGIADRKGHLGVGADADVTVFDPAHIRDRATFASPALPPDGIRDVLIGGEFAVRDGEVVNAHAGKAVRK